LADEFTRQPFAAAEAEAGENDRHGSAIFASFVKLRSPSGTPNGVDGLSIRT
jgi:hypothetical protein